MKQQNNRIPNIHYYEKSIREENRKGSLKIVTLPKVARPIRRAAKAYRKDRESKRNLTKKKLSFSCLVNFREEQFSPKIDFPIIMVSDIMDNAHYKDLFLRSEHLFRS